MIPIDRWNEHVARMLNDPLLTSARLQELRINGLLIIAREEREVLGAVCLVPLNDDLGIVHGLLVCDPDPREQHAVAVPLVKNILGRAAELGRTALIPPWVTPYVQGPVMTKQETGTSFNGFQRLMDAARVPRNHTLRNAQFKIAGRKPQMTANAPHTTTHTEL